jgi:hypothetical protein
MAPDRTDEPEPTFTPRRWALESRPLRDEAAPFFLDMADAPVWAQPAEIAVISMTEYCWRWPQRRRWLDFDL